MKNFHTIALCLAAALFMRVDVHAMEDPCEWFYLMAGDKYLVNDADRFFLCDEQEFQEEFSKDKFLWSVDDDGKLTNRKHNFFKAYLKGKYIYVPGSWNTYVCDGGHGSLYLLTPEHARQSGFKKMEFTLVQPRNEEKKEFSEELINKWFYLKSGAWYLVNSGSGFILRHEAEFRKESSKDQYFWSINQKGELINLNLDNYKAHLEGKYVCVYDSEKEYIHYAGGGSLYLCIPKLGRLHGFERMEFTPVKYGNEINFNPAQVFKAKKAALAEEAWRKRMADVIGERDYLKRQLDHIEEKATYSKEKHYYSAYKSRTMTPFLDRIAKNIQEKEGDIKFVDGYWCSEYSGSDYGVLNDWPDQGYCDPFESCISMPLFHEKASLSRDKWIFELTEQIQTDCRFNSEGHPVPPVVPDEADKLGTYKTAVTIAGYEVPCVVTCTRKMYQTPRTNKRTFVTSSGRVGSYGCSDADPFAPWRIVQKRSYVIDPKVVEGVCHMNRTTIAFLDRFQFRTDNISPFYKVYNMNDRTRTRNQILESARMSENAGLTMQALMLFLLAESYDEAARICDNVFMSVNSISDLVSKFCEVSCVLYNRYSHNSSLSANVRFYNYALSNFFFAGMPRFDKSPYRERWLINHLHPGAADLYYRCFWPIRDKYFSDFTYYTDMHENLQALVRKRFVTDLEMSLENLPYLNRLLDCPDTEWNRDVHACIENILRLEYLELKLALSCPITDSQAENLRVRIRKLSKYIIYGHETSAECISELNGMLNEHLKK